MTELDSTLCVGFGEADITPVPPPHHPGVAPAFRVLDRLAFRAMAFKQGDTHAVLLSGDFFSFEQALLDLAAGHLRHIPWLDSRNILACVSHCGGAPILAPSYVSQPCALLRVFGQEELYARLAADAIDAAIRNLRPARIAFASVAAPGFSYNRRSFDNDGKLVMSNFMLPYPRQGLTYQGVDENVYVIRVDEASPGDESRPSGAAIIFGCHALSRRDCYGHVWADYPASARGLVADALDIPVIFMQGALGDVVPIGRTGRTHEQIGHGIGGAALLAIERLGPAKGTTLRVRRTVVRVPMFDSDYIESRLRGTTGEADAGDVRFWKHTYSRLKGGETELNYPITIVEAGAAAIVHLPGEVFAQTAREIQERSPYEVTIVISGPTADVGYLCPAEAHEQGGMEPEFAALAGGAETLIREAAIELLSLTGPGDQHAHELRDKEKQGERFSVENPIVETRT